MNLSVALGLVIIAALAALCYAAFSFFKVKKLEEGTDRMQEIAAAIRLGANTFIRYEYKILIVVVLVVAVVLALLISWQAARRLYHRYGDERRGRLRRHENRHLRQRPRFE